MTQFTSPEQILTFGRQAITLMERHKALPSPENYELWFAYAGQRNAALVSALDQAVRDGRASDLDHAGLLHARFFGQSPSETFEEIGVQLNVELNKLTGSLMQAGEDTAVFDKTLTHAGAELDHGVPDIKSIVQKLAAATRAVQVRNKSLEEQLQSLAKEVDGLRTRMESIRKESLTDALTGLANRRCFDDTAQRAIDAAMTEGKPMSLIISDIDHFKKFNDTYGHSIGDQVLRLVAQSLKTNVKGKDLAARFGGEEFVVILPETSLENASRVANDIRKTVETKKIVQKSSGKDMGTVTLSLGVAQYVPGEDIADLLNRADACLYSAKRGGRNRVVTEKDIVGTGVVAQGDSNNATSDATQERSQESLRFEYAVRAICREGAMPLRSNIDLRQFHRFARWMIIAEPDVAARQVPMRLVGSGFHNLMGRDTTGVDYLELMEPSIRERAFDMTMALVNTPCALWQVSPNTLSTGKTVLMEYTIFPMLHEKVNKHQLLIFVHHDLAEGVRGDGNPTIKSAKARQWLDLGKGFPTIAAKSQAA